MTHLAKGNTALSVSLTAFATFIAIFMTPFNFEFYGVFDNIKTNETIAYMIGDGRKVKIDFLPDGLQTRIIESFEVEEENSFEMQQNGWQAILNNFKKYTEEN